MKGGLEKYLYFNSVKLERDEPIGREGYRTTNDIDDAEAAVFNSTTVKHESIADFSASQAIFKVKGAEGVVVDDTIVVVDSNGEVVEGLIDAGVVNAIASIDADLNYSITMDANVTGALVRADRYTPVYAVFTTPGSPKDPTRQAQAVCYPAERLKGYLLEPVEKTVKDPKSGETKTSGRDTLVMVFEPLIGSPSEFENSTTELNWDYVYLTCTPGSQRKVVQAISHAINGNRNLDHGFISVFDGVTGDHVSQDITNAVPIIATNK